MDDLVECFTEDASADYAIGTILEGRDEIIQFLKDNVAREDLNVTSVHQGHNPEIDIISESSAIARWGLYNLMYFGQARTIIRSWQVYDDNYVKIDGEWKIKHTKITYITTETTAMT
jgi:hypothetical protein